jgi:hypothetical protein
MRRVSKALRRQLNLNEGKNLLHSEVEQLLEIDETFLSALEEMVAAPAGLILSNVLVNLAADAAEAFVGKIYALNQYIQIDTQSKEALKQIYIETWHKLVETREVESTIRSYHYPKIKAFMEAKYPQTLAAGLKTATHLGHVPSSEYSAEHQMKLLRLELQTIKEPILDVGCGGEAYLIRFLRSKNFEAYGFDRLIRDRTSYLSEADWFDYEYGYGRWGTILSNLSFANHLVYAQRYEAATPAMYLKTFLKMLDSLKVEGTFIYAPAVDQLEKQIDPIKYRIEKWEISPVAKVTRISRIAL